MTDSFSFAHVLVLGIVGYFAYQIYLGFVGSGKKFVCKACGNIGESNTTTSGNIVIEIILWLCLIIPGVIYSIWRMTSKHEACSKCGSKEVIPTDSPIGRKLVADLGGMPADPDIASPPLHKLDKHRF